MGSIHTNNLSASEKELDLLKSFQKELITLGDEYMANQVNIHIKTTEAWLELVKGDEQEALALMIMATDMESKTSKHPVTPGEILPVDELLGDMLLALNKPNEALNAYEVNLKRHPNRFNGIYGAAIAAKLSNNQEKVVSYFNQLIDLTKNAGNQRPEVEEAKAFLGHKTI